MAMTQLTLLFIGVLALLATVGMFINFGDDATRIVISFLAAILWSVVGMSAFEVTVVDQGQTTTVSLAPLAYIGIALAIMTFAFSLYQIIQILGKEAGATDAPGLLR